MRKAVLPAALLLLATGRVPLALAQDLPAAPQRPAIGLNRWQEDWSVLADPALRTEPLDALKYIPLGAGASPAWLSLGGGLRERIETNHAPLFHTVAGLADTYLLSRLELHGDVRCRAVSGVCPASVGLCARQTTPHDGRCRSAWP